LTSKGLADKLADAVPVQTLTPSMKYNKICVRYVSAG
jgi:hypothetical protein